MTGQRPITFFTVYRRTSDLPAWPVVVRPARIAPETPGLVAFGPIACLCFGLEEARDALRGLGCVRFERSPDDDPVIIESWML